MDRNELLELEKLSNIPLKTLKTESPELFAHLESKATSRLKESLVARFGRSPEALRRCVEDLDVQVADDLTIDIKGQVLDHLQSAGAADELCQEAEALLDAMDLPDSLEDTLQPDVPLSQNPLFHAELEQARLYLLGEVAGLPPDRQEAVVREVSSSVMLTDARLASLVEANDLSEDQAKDLGLTASLFRLCDENLALAVELRPKVKHIKDLVVLGKGGWLTVLEEAKAQPPQELAPEAYASLLAKKIENLYPSLALSHRLIPRETGDLEASIQELGPEFANRFPGLNIQKILDNDDADKVEKITQRVGLLKDFQAQNPDLELLALDYTPDSSDLGRLTFNGMSPDEQTMVLSTWKAYQRAYSITRDVEHTGLLVEKGYHSALRVVHEGLDRFREKTGLNADVSQTYYDKAAARVGASTLATGSVLDMWRGGFDWLRVSNLSPPLEGYLKKIDGFEDLFGSQDYCTCEHCRSILGPAAYFVDLMYFVEKKILEKHFGDGKQDHPLDLKVRRPDLWTLPLTCENTETMMPYLDIINEILENYLAQSHKPDDGPTNRSEAHKMVYGTILPHAKTSFRLPFSLALEELQIYLGHFGLTRGAVAAQLESTGDDAVKATLNLSKTEYELITHANAARDFLGDLYGVQFKVGASDQVEPFDAQLLLRPMGLTRAQLGDLVQTRFVTANDSQQIEIRGEKTTEESVQNDIERIYGLTLDALDRMHRFTRLWRRLPWSIRELDLVLSHLNRTGAGGAALTSSTRPGPDHDINEETLKYSVPLLSMQKRFGISVEELCALWGPLPTDQVSAEKESLFDRLFNLPEFVLGDVWWPDKDNDEVKEFIHPAFTATGEVDESLPRLLAGLRVTDEELYLLITALSTPLELDLEASGEDKKRFQLNIDNLSLLYRHARLARLLKLSIPRLFQLISLAPQPDSARLTHIGNLDKLVDLLRFFDWWGSTDYSLDDLGFITSGQVLDSKAYSDGEAIGTQIIEDVQADRALVFADTVFAFVEGVTETQSRTIMATNAAGLEPVTPGGTAYWLSEGFDPNAEKLTFRATLFAFLEGVTNEQSQEIIKANQNVIEQTPDSAYQLSDSFRPNEPLILPTLDPPIPATEADVQSLLIPYFLVKEADIKNLLLPYHATQIIPNYLSASLGLSVEKTKALIKMVVEDGEDREELADPKYTKALQGENAANGDLPALIKKLLPWVVLFRDEAFDADTLEFIKKEVPNIDTSIPNVETIAAYRSFVEIDGDEQDNRQQLQEVLDDFNNPGSVFQGTVENQLAQILGAEPGLTRPLQQVVVDDLVGTETALEALAQLRRYVALAQKLGVSGGTLADIVLDDDDQLALASAALLGAFRAKYEDEAEWKEKIEPFQNKIRGRKRDALTDYLLSSAHPEFETLNDLYHYLLIDVELEGCARISKLVAAISSVQLYVHRCLINLEQNDPSPRLTREEQIEAEMKKAGWTTVEFYSVNDQAFLFALRAAGYDDKNKNVCVYRIQDDGTLQKPPVFRDKWTEGWTTAKFYAVGGKTYLFILKAQGYDGSGNHNVHIYEIPGGDVEITNRVAAYKWATDWSAAQVCTISDCSYLFLLAEEEGTGSGGYGLEIRKINENDGKAGDPIPPDRTKAWTHARTLKIGDRRFRLFLAEDDTDDTSVDCCHIIVDCCNIEKVEEVHVLPEDVPAGEWAWRKNYRVWEANRKVFLHPENYIEPELRDNKTPLFEQLESELLQQQINADTVLDAYANFMRGFEEVAHLKTAGSYHDKDHDSRTDILHLFGVTPGDPPTYYYRAIENAYFGERDDDRGVVWSPWRKIEVQIPVRKVAPIVYRGRLYIFWVEITTQPQSKFVGGDSKFVGYKHTMSLKFTRLKLDGTWTPPQKISLNIPLFFEGDGIIIEEISNNNAEPRDGYTLTGFAWDQVYPTATRSDARLFVTGRDFKMVTSILSYGGFDPSPWFFNCTVLCSKRKLLQPTTLYYGKKVVFKDQADSYYWANYAIHSILLEESRICEYPGLWALINDEGLYSPEDGLAELDPDVELSLINGALQSAVIDSMGDLLLLQYVGGDLHWQLRRLGTTLSETVAATLFVRGVEGLLDTANQEKLREADLPIVPNESYVEDASNAGALDFTGSFGTYYREIFFHIPFLIANHLNSQAKFAEAQKWYHYLFNPTASEVIPADHPKPDPQDRNWRYLEFREHDIQTLRWQLIDGAAIAAYKRDPFNPHAIARLRLSAYQKCIVMKYIDNLLDWGDHLFAQDTLESINEATLLYVMAADILGERPAELGACGEDKAKEITYEEIRSIIDRDDEDDEDGSEFLIEMEHEVVRGRGHAGRRGLNADYRYVIDDLRLDVAAGNPDGVTGGRAQPVTNGARLGGGILRPDWKRTRTTYWTGHEGAIAPVASHDSPEGQANREVAAFGLGLVRQIKTPVFCVPANKKLLKCWDRVEDRLYKIRNCMNISGVRRELSLFAPEIDPGLLVRARAAGLSLEDVLNALSSNLPPYRFSYLIEKAKSYAASVQGFGSALLSALEKKDVEELNLLRSVHEQNILKMTTQIKEWERDAAEETRKSLELRKKGVKYRREHYEGLIKADLTPWERAQQVSTYISGGLRSGAAIFDFVAGVAHLIPELGAPTSLKYGGKQLGNSADSWSQVMRDLAVISDSVAAASGLEASFERRAQEWQHQVDLAGYEHREDPDDPGYLDKEYEAAKIRKEIAEKSIEIHQKSIEQQDEVYKFYQDKFSQLGLYTWLSSTLHRLYREAYNSAYQMAKLAEQAYRFERGDDAGALIGASHWEASRAGLLAGERLLIDLQNLERRFIETNYRDLEINQSFSLTQIDPEALIGLKETGTCEFEISEIFFDLFYPGHYRRKIKAVRLSIPCITGPYTNVSATLTLLGSRLRNEPQLGPVYLKDVPRTRSVTIATSSAQNDAGVFELNFRDERYMPFEGAGAISRWKLSLPKSFRQFDYQTINDVIIHISYTAEEDGGLREHVENLQEGIEGTLVDFLKNNSLPRIFSLRHEFSGEFHRLLHGPAGQAVKITLTDKHFPIFLKGKSLKATGAFLVLRPAKDQSVDGFTISINGPDQTDFAQVERFGGLPSKDLGASLVPVGILGDYALAIEAPGELAPPDSTATSGAPVIDSGKLKDIYLCLEYTIDGGGD